MQALWDEDSTQSQEQLSQTLNVTQGAISQCLKARGRIQKFGKRVPYQFNDRQMENQKTVCEMLLQLFERKSFCIELLRGTKSRFILRTRSKKKSWLSPGQADPSTARPNRFGRKITLCICLDQRGVVYNELLKAGETNEYRQQMIKLCVDGETAGISPQTF